MNLSEMLPDQPLLDLKEVRGLWVPNRILYRDEITHMEKILLSFIYNLDSPERHCYASNKYLAELMQVSEPTLANALTTLKKKELIKKISWNGNIRVMGISFDVDW